ncbi:hypothetical protein GCM10028801_31020 [Nocardioides maradonensis]
MALASTAAENQALDGLSGGSTNLLAYVSLHSGSPSTTGANEFSGGGYARQACSWNAASSGSKTNSSALTFTTSGSTAATYFGTWSASTSGTFGIGGALTSSVTAVTITVAAGALTLSAS